MKYHYIHIGIAYINENTRFWQGYRTTETFIYCCCSITWYFHSRKKKNLAFLIKLNLYLNTVTEILLGIYPGEMDAYRAHKTCTKICTAVFFIIARTENNPNAHLLFSCTYTPLSNKITK